jgi:hypothetical protein
MKKLFFLLPAAGIVSMGCEPTYCTLSFDTVGFIWTDSVHTPHHVVSVVRESQDTLATQFENTPPYFVVATDEHQSLFLHHTYLVDVYIFNHQDSLLAQSEYLISADECHILKMNGPEFLPQ